MTFDLKAQPASISFAICGLCRIVSVFFFNLIKVKWSEVKWSEMICICFHNDNYALSASQIQRKQQTELCKRTPKQHKSWWVPLSRCNHGKKKQQNKNEKNEGI